MDVDKAISVLLPSQAQATGTLLLWLKSFERRSSSCLPRKRRCFGDSSTKLPKLVPDC